MRAFFDEQGRTRFFAIGVREVRRWRKIAENTALRKKNHLEIRNLSRWATAVLFACDCSCQRCGFCAASVFVWSSFWSKYGWQRIFYKRFCRSPFCENVWLPPDLFLSLASVTVLFASLFKNRWREQSQIPAHATLSNHSIGVKGNAL